MEELRSSRHGGQPEVEIAFAAAGRAWLLRKRFSGASGTVQLSDGAGTSLSGAAAEERLAALLGVEAAVEGRQLAQLPQRWAHLGVRQGEAGGNPLQGKGPSHDLDRLVQQLQQRGSSATLESPLDRRVEALLQAERDQLFTATGKVRAGSPLALARQEQAQAAADREQALRALEQAEAQAALERSRRKPLAQQLLSLRGQLQQLAELTAAQQVFQAESEQGQRSQAEQQRRQQQLSQELEQLHQSLASLQAALAERSRALERGQLLLERAAAAQRSEELTVQRRRFAALQEQAAALKAQLEPLPPISAEQLKALRQAERSLALARGRAEAAAARLEVLAADQPLRLDDRPLQAGASVQIEAAAILQVGAGVRLRLSPGGGEARATLRAPLGVRDGDEAEALLRRRSAHESELAQRRRSAAEIPWQRLDSQLAAVAVARLPLPHTVAMALSLRGPACGAGLVDLHPLGRSRATFLHIHVSEKAPDVQAPDARLLGGVIATGPHDLRLSTSPKSLILASHSDPLILGSGGQPVQHDFAKLGKLRKPDEHRSPPAPPVKSASQPAWCRGFPEFP